MKKSEKFRHQILNEANLKQGSTLDSFLKKHVHLFMDKLIAMLISEIGSALEVSVKRTGDNTLLVRSRDAREEYEVKLEHNEDRGKSKILFSIDGSTVTQFRKKPVLVRLLKKSIVS